MTVLTHFQRQRWTFNLISNLSFVFMMHPSLWNWPAFYKIGRIFLMFWSENNFGTLQHWPVCQNKRLENGLNLTITAVFVFLAHGTKLYETDIHRWHRRQWKWFLFVCVHLSAQATQANPPKQNNGNGIPLFSQLLCL